ncbi:uncharacterized protein K489DRAFT_324292 [Dissoconium aciculare CBS 342.82]|uniref:Uncharacterized protein n=1 Tax=Dissoconium aciculare CBS 342.82 TaxID=1314786 RepID=A0A6J3LY04_9PEZI|nr:uncharacterized protein K489DRAFT_324292 [Dissoconium aciculare CBS 342.82]KAF1820169.1 hypothetical protein K489DRAFT_324292 [Dissoconium aciculare CBS 342.82]
MARPVRCQHAFTVTKTPTEMIYWTCNQCYSGPHWYIFECRRCRFKVCQPCAAKISVRPAAAVTTAKAP